MTALDKCVSSMVVYNAAVEEMERAVAEMEESVLALHRLSQEGKVSDLARLVAVEDLIEVERTSQRLKVAVEELTERLITEFQLTVEGKGS